MCVSVATEYNKALLIVENNNIGWSAIQTIIDSEYPNLFYTSKDLTYVDTAKQISNRYRSTDRNMVPGFSMTNKTRPLVIAKLDEYFREKSVNISSQRLIDELFVFIYKNGKAIAMSGYNDDLVMSLAIGLWVRDTALRLRAEGIELTKRSLDYFQSHQAIYDTDGENENDSWKMDVGKEQEDLTWLIK
jgi:hypothetical protein